MKMARIYRDYRRAGFSRRLAGHHTWRVLRCHWYRPIRAAELVLYYALLAGALGVILIAMWK